MVSLLSKGFFLFLFILPDVLRGDKTEWLDFIVDAEGNRFYLGHIPEVERLPKKKLPEMKLRQSLPESFDARNKWPECKDIIGLIRNQKACGSCWAFSIAEIISDRICIQSKGKKKVVISPEDLMTCCNYKGCDGCMGGPPEKALKYWKENGIVTGGDYNSHEGCRPYTIPDYWDNKTPLCKKKCKEGYLVPYEADKHYGLEAQSVGPNVKEIQQDIYDNGPVSAVFDIYDDFGNYTRGVYSHPTAKTNKSHAIKIIGWGVEDGTPYWLCANSYGARWGDKGYFKILRGDPKNDCSIEKRVNTGTPQL